MSPRKWAIGAGIFVLFIILLAAAYEYSTPQYGTQAGALEGDGYRLVQVGDMPLFIRIYDPTNQVTGCYFDRVQAREIVCTNKEATPNASS